MKWAVAKGYRQDNPAGDALAQALPRHTVVRRHLRALPHGAVAGAIQAVRASRASAPVKLAFELLVLTAARSGEVRLATWDEMDLDAAVWLVPGARMKAKRDHRVPLSEASARDPRRRAEPARRRRPRVPQSARQAALRHDAVEVDQGTRPPRGAAWVPVELQGLGGGADKYAP